MAGAVRVTCPDRFGTAQAVADAVLYEGYVLYPYRASSPKNQVRWQFGVLMPPAWVRTDSSERSSVRTECLVAADPTTRLSTRIRFLQKQHRSVLASESVAGADVPLREVDRLEVDGTTYVTWDEAIDRTVDVGTVDLGSILDTERVGGPWHGFEFGGGTERESIRRSDGSVAGRLVRHRHPVGGRIRIDVERAGGTGLVKVTITVENTTGGTGGESGRDGALGSALLALHAMAAVDGGRFVSLLDPPAGAELAAAGCRSDGIHPVLVGDDRVVLASPIILYDHPAVAPESPGDLYDATEIDEILALRVLTLTEAEKREARGTDPRAAAIVDRCDGMTPEMWDRLHGTFRPMAPDDRSALPSSPLDGPAGVTGWDPTAGVTGWDPTAAAPWWDPTVDAGVDPFSDSVEVGGADVRKGTSVRLRPSRRSDAQDLFYKGRCATVAGVFRDVDGSIQVAVTIDGDPAGAELVWQGRYLFFHPDEIEPLIGPQGGPEESR